MNLFRFVAGQVCLELTCADMAKALSDLRSQGIALSDAAYIDDLCLRITLSRREAEKVKAYASRKGWGLKPMQQKGIFWSLIALQHRPVLVVGLLGILLLSLFLPGRILFVRVEGNTTVPTNRILESAADHGVWLGASGRELRSEHIKNAMLDDIPQLQWLGVNVGGCVAVISVRERQPASQAAPNHPVTGISAKVDGIIQSVTVTRGTALCKPGDAVTAGQTLISGYSDLGICQRLTQAEGEVYALTRRQITAKAPKNYALRGECHDKKVKYALLIGNKRINFYKSSGILDGSCARIYMEWYMTLPGGFALPVGFVKEIWMDYDSAGEGTATVDLANNAGLYLLSQLTDGQILTGQTELNELDNALILHGSYACREMIGVTQIEENWNDYGKDNGKDRQR